MGQNIGSVGLALCAILIGTASAWALAPHDKAVGPGQGGHSQPPSLAIGIQGSHEQTDATTSNDRRAYEVRGTEQAPLIIKTAPSDDAQAKATEDAAERKAKAASDWWLIVLTAVLAVATIALVIVTGGLVWFAWRQADDMKKSTAASEASSLAAVKAAGLAETALVGIETPYLYPVLSGRDATITEQGSGALTLCGVVSVIWKNAGRSPAILFEEVCHPVAAPTFPDPSSYERIIGTNILAEMIETGNTSEGMSIEIASRFQRQCDPITGALISDCYMVGCVRYGDVFGNQYISGFSFFYNTVTHRFISMGNGSTFKRRNLTEQEQERVKQAAF